MHGIEESIEWLIMLKLSYFTLRITVLNKYWNWIEKNIQVFGITIWTCILDKHFIKRFIPRSSSKLVKYIDNINTSIPTQTLPK